MNDRTTESIVTFRNTFSIGSAVIDEPAGGYRITKVEELIEGLSYPAFRTISMSIQIPAIGKSSLTTQFYNIGSEELYAALRNDANLSGKVDAPASHDPSSMLERARAFRKTPSE
jgi:hypothetical protein